jgi:predicted RNA-binding Zn-ribbon protein involved in translation (DUF1610 family)
VRKGKLAGGRISSPSAARPASVEVAILHPVRDLKAKHMCPECQSTAIVRLGRGDVLERLILKMRRKLPYRCLDCDHRFLDRPISK